MGATRRPAASGCTAGTPRICGGVLRVIRESIGRTQEQLAEDLGVDPNTLKGWETGRRPLMNIPGHRILVLRRHLLQAGAEPRQVATLDTAIEADYLFGHITNTNPQGAVDLRRHPLTSCVLRRDVVAMLAWPFTGQAPAELPSTVAPPVSRADRDLFFGNLRTTVDRAIGSRADGHSHRQIYYLLQWDGDTDTREWLEQVQRVELRQWRAKDGWSPQWVTARSMAVTQARQGDPEPLRWFVEAALSGEEATDADLNYWAYWVGEIPDIQRDDNFMAGGLGRWHGAELLRRFYHGLVTTEPVVDLYAHSARALIERRPLLLEEDPPLTASLQRRVENLLDAGPLHPGTRRNLEDIRLSVRLVTGRTAARGFGHGA